MLLKSSYRIKFTHTFVKNFTTTEVRCGSNVASMLVYSEYGDPLKVIRKKTQDVPHPKENEVLVAMLAAPVNPADINSIQGKYPAKSQLPTVAGIEGIGEVLEAGPGAKDYSKGDRVVFLEYGLGTWRTHALFQKNQLLKVPRELGIVEGATLTVNPCTAYRMLKDFASLKPGDTMIQNGANSAVGQTVIQICKAWGLRSVNVVRDRPNIAELKTFLTSLGATQVLTEEELRKTDLFKSRKLHKPKLALNCVGGQSALELTRHLQPGSPMVTYGGMSMERVKVPTSALIFKGIRIRGFWVTEWAKKNASSSERQKMFDELISMMVNKELCGPAHKMVDFDQYEEALLNTLGKGMTGKKYILNLKID